MGLQPILRFAIVLEPKLLSDVLLAYSATSSEVGSLLNFLRHIMFALYNMKVSCYLASHALRVSFNRDINSCGCVFLGSLELLLLFLHTPFSAVSVVTFLKIQCAAKV
jgi:hypothetical protein